MRNDERGERSVPKVRPRFGEHPLVVLRQAQHDNTCIVPKVFFRKMPFKYGFQRMKHMSLPYCYPEPVEGRFEIDGLTTGCRRLIV